MLIQKKCYNFLDHLIQTGGAHLRRYSSIDTKMRLIALWAFDIKLHMVFRLG